MSVISISIANFYSVPEPPTRVIAQNNALAASTKNDNPYLTERLFDSVPSLSPTEKHFEHQASILKRNRYVINIQSLKYSGVAYSTSSIISKYPSPTISPYINTLAVLNAAAHCHGESSKASLKQILPHLEKRPNDVGLLLTIIHLYLLTNNSGPAITLLEKFFKRLEESTTPTDLDVRFAPGLVALIVSLYRISGRKAPIKTELSKAATYWRRKPQHSPDTLLRAAGISLLSSSKPEDLNAAGEIFTSLREQDGNDRIAIAGFVASYASTDYSKVKPELEKLTPIPRLISGIDAAALEEAGVPTLPAPTPAPSSKKRTLESTEKDASKQAKKQKIRKSKMPKDYVEGKAMDPERWLPLRDRSSYRPKGKKGKKKAMELTQGGVVKEEGESLELAGGAGTVKVEKAAGGGGSGKAKKKKGKK
jgi:signal recognition particle subunit SRP72